MPLLTVVLASRSRRAPVVLAAAVSLASMGTSIGACSEAKDEARPKDHAQAEAGPGEDAGAVPEGGPSGPSFCSTLAPAPFFCADFDDGAAPDQVFAAVTGAVKVEDRALHVATDGADAFVEHDADPSPHWTRIELAFSLRVEQTAKDTRAVLARIGQHQADSECRLELEVQESGLRLTGTGVTEAPLTKTVAAGAAARVVLTLDASGDAGAVTGMATVDGQPAIAAPVTLGCASLPGPPRVSLGRVSGAGRVDLRFDDVVFDGR